MSTKSKRTPAEIQPLRGRVPGGKLLASAHRAEIDRWLFSERASLREVERRCKENGWEIGRRTLAAYAENAGQMLTSAASDALPGVVLVDRAEESLHRLQRIFSTAGEQLEKLTQGGQLSAKELIDLKKLEVTVYGAQNIADFSQSEEKWRRAILAVGAAITQVCPPEIAQAVLALLMDDPDWCAVMNEGEEE